MAWGGWSNNVSRFTGRLSINRLIIDLHVLKVQLEMTVMMGFAAGIENN